MKAAAWLPTDMNPPASIQFRQVALPEDISGALYLHSLPGRYESWQDARQAFHAYGLDGVICLETRSAIELKSPEYARALHENDTGVPVEQFPIPDYSVPQDREAFFALAQASAVRLRRRQKLLVHCGAGIGRTGTFAAAILLALGLPLETALARVHAAGSQPETPDQDALLADLAGKC